MPTADLVLSRFPRHLDADAPGKVIGEVVGALATAAETQIVQVGHVRRSRRIGELDQLTDLARVIALHGFGLAVLAALFRRVRGADPAIRYDEWLDVARQVVADLIVLQREESGTVRGLLGATAASLGLRVTDVDHDPDGYWHLARCVDLLDRGSGVGTDAPPTLLALEENPPRLADLGPSPFAHSARFSVMRQGFDTVPATVIVTRVENRTMRPMVVNVDDGFGVATTVAVPDGATLRFERDGRVELDGASVVRSSYTFSGAVFADASADHERDFVFADTVDAVGAADDAGGDRAARFAVTSPIDDAFDDVSSLPHASPLLPAVRLDRRETRFAAFVGVGAFGARLGDDVTQPAPQPWSGRFDQSVFLPETPPAGAPAFEIGFEWDEREAYAVRVWLPREYQDLDADDETPIREVVRGQLDRYRAGGVHVYTAHADPRWTLGVGIVRDVDTDAALGVVVAGTEAWEDDIEQPGGGP